ncbi:NAD(P)-dependent alcohol dehydrogenase [Chitinophaga nivalis]|uniref:NAD(P)-dependent alcohol dehydrogenase n=1 Tax=Chitinophaga nivalis TaxID=2991709 RepID=A0ABT3II60_9BACT|nr:NAD(P)-dependent alcohol dehydrogenase [Chitinophaga nivalis]MCW3466656.1 NAD(P)-dependent alcohol dehydrogenase [Chitinophaga nivalis]MCW3483653.1 NAD(P)-dependent alcohol dehydrogenase [Chitinophaga nivalis]
MIPTKGYAAHDANLPLSPFEFERKPVGDNDILIAILFCGVCHTDIHVARNEWGNAVYPLVPGHEIIGRVIAVGKNVRKFKPDDIAGAGYLYDSCKSCDSCTSAEEQYCTKGITAIMGDVERDNSAPTYGGYSSHLVISEDYAVKVPEALPLAAAAPLLCAGITTYSPLKFVKAGPGHKIGVAGLGGLGHMAVKIGKALGAEITVLSTSPGKREDALQLGAHDFRLISSKEEIKSLQGYFHFIVDTIAADHDYNRYLHMLKKDGALLLVALPEAPVKFTAGAAIFQRRSIIGSLIGSIRETQEMMDFCAAHQIVADVEVIPISQINEAFERIIKGDVHYRFVIDMSTL